MKKPPVFLIKRSAMSPRSRSLGFTLIELMFVVALAAVMLGLAAPTFRDFVADQRVKTAAGEYASALVQARSEAIKRNASVTVTAKSSGVAGWKDGWRVEVGAVTLLDQAPYPELTASGPSAAVTYIGTGRLGAAAGTLTITASHAEKCSYVAIDLSGMPKTSKATKNSNGTCP